MKTNLLIPFLAACIQTSAFLNAAGSHAFNQDNGPALEQRIRNRIDNIKIIDTHEHQGFPYMKRHNCFDISMYMIADLVSSGMPPISESMEKVHDPEVYWNHVSPYLKFSRTTSYHAQFIQNLKQMYDLKGDELTKDEFLRISAQVDRNFKNYAQWLDSGLKKLNIDLMLVDRVWDPFNPVMEHEKFGYVFRFDRLITDVRSLSREKKITDEKILKLTGKKEILLPTLDEYLEFTDLVLEFVQKHHAIALKMGLAYHRSLDFAEVAYEKAKSVYALENKSREELKELQDFLVHHIVKKAGEAKLPVQIHTGYLHGNNNDLNRGNPSQLIPLFQRYPNTKFILFHGSYPWTGNFIAIAKNFTNVYADLVWLPQISRTNAINTLHELLDTVPYNKIMWGGDVGKIDETAGSLELAKEVIVAVLAERIRKGWLKEEVAFDICARIFRENAMEIIDIK